jgi:hypothetical protein
LNLFLQDLYEFLHQLPHAFSPYDVFQILAQDKFFKFVAILAPSYET